VIKALESGNGNPGLASDREDCRGLRACRGVCEKRHTVAEILDGEARAQENARSREADAEALPPAGSPSMRSMPRTHLKSGVSDLRYRRRDTGAVYPRCRRHY